MVVVVVASEEPRDRLEEVVLDDLRSVMHQHGLDPVGGTGRVAEKKKHEDVFFSSEGSKCAGGGWGCVRVEGVPFL